MSPKPPRRSDSDARLRRDIVCGLMLVVAAAAPFVAVWSRQFLNWDDRNNVVDNGAVRWLTPTNVAYMFKHPIGANYVPLTWLSHALDWQIFGDDAWGHGLTNAVLHAVCCCLLVACLRKGGLGAPQAWLAGFLFAVHPVHAENVAWISGRKDILCAAALLACQHAYMAWRAAPRRAAYVWSLIWLVAAGLSKPAAMSAVICLWLYDVVWLQRTARDACRALLPHAVICAGVAVIAVLGQRSGSAFADATDRRWGAIDLAACNLLYELLRSWLPFPFSPFLPNSLLENVPGWMRWGGALLLVVASITLAVRASGSQAWKAAAWWWFGSIGFLLPVSGLVPLGHTSLADRYLYLPSLGPCVFIAVAVVSFARHWTNPHRARLAGPRAFAPASSLISSATNDGKPVAEETVKKLRLTVTREGGYKTELGDQVLFDSTCTVDSDRTPKQIDMIGTEGENKGKAAKGIYALDKDKLTICYTMPGKERPKELESKPGSAATYVVWKRK